MESDDILRHLSQFQEFNREYKAIQKDISDYKKKHNKRLNEIRGLIDESEKQIVEYMKMNNHPGLNYRGMLITLSKKPQGNRLSVQKRKEKINSLFKKYDIDTSDPMYDDFQKIFLVDKHKDKIKLHNIKA
jgi:hypothetical protein